MSRKWVHNDPDYLNYDREQKLFIQQMLYLEYVEEWEIARFHSYDDYIGLENQMTMDMLDYEDAECYEICQLYRDVLKRYKKDIREFDNQ